MDKARFSVIAPTTGGPVRVVGVRPRPRLQASYVALKGDFRPLAMSGDYHNFVSGPLAAHAVAEGAHELLLSADIDSGRSWEIPTLIAHLLGSADLLCDDDGAGEAAEIIWATGAVDPELNPQADDYAVARKCALASEQFAAWHTDGRKVHLIVPAGMPVSDQQAVEQVAATHGFRLTLADTFRDIQRAIDVLPSQSSEVDAAVGLGGESDVVAVNPPATRPRWLVPGVLAFGAALAIGVWSGLRSFGSDPSTSPSTEASSQRTNGSPVVALVRLSARNREDCIDRIMLTQPMTQTSIPVTDRQIDISSGEGLCGIRFVNQSRSALLIKIEGGLTNAAIRGNNALFQGLDLAAGEGTDLIFSRDPAALRGTVILRGDGTAAKSLEVVMTSDASAN